MFHKRPALSDDSTGLLVTKVQISTICNAKISRILKLYKNRYKNRN